MEPSELTTELQDFALFSAEYAQALDALEELKNQAETLMVMGSSEELRLFIDRFIDMASSNASLAREKDQEHFHEWFLELVQRAQELRVEMTTG
jgi:hypothetical protein